MVLVLSKQISPSVLKHEVGDRAAALSARGVDDVLSTDADGNDLALNLQWMEPALLGMRDASEKIKVDRGHSSRVIARCTEILTVVHDGVQAVGTEVESELQSSVSQLQKAFEEVHGVLCSQAQRSLPSCYLKRSESRRNIERCDASLDIAIKTFKLKVQTLTSSMVRTYQAREVRDLDLIFRSLRAAALNGEPLSPHTISTDWGYGRDR